MLKVIIADDERRICNLILNIVPWSDLGYQVVATANNGLEAFNLIREHQPDVVITDARMPGYDGIELIKHTRESNLNPEFIIISGYKYFEYAYNALQYGVEHYLLKPINKLELCEALGKIKKGKLDENEKLEKNVNILNRLEMNRETMRRHFIRNFVFDGSSFNTSNIVSLEKANSEYGMSFIEGIYQSIFIKIDNTVENDVSHEIVLNKVIAEVDKTLKECCEEYISTIAKSGIIVLTNYLTLNKEKFQSAVEDLANKLKSTIDKFNCFKVTIGLGISETNFENIPDCVSSALEAIKFRISNPEKEIISFEEYKYNKVNMQLILTPERKQQFKLYIESNEKENCKKFIDMAIKEIHKEKNYSPSAFYEFYDCIALILEQYVDELGISKAAFEELYERYTSILNNAYEEAAVKEVLYNYSSSVCSFITSEKEFQDKKPIRMAKRYIEDHFAEEINLESVAKAIHLTSTYVSTIFRKETGLNFSEYLINCRISAAKNLLKKTDKNMVEIAENIGYSDVKYFSKLFNKVVGLKPSEYRKLFS